MRPVVRGLSPQRSSAAASSPEPEAVAEAAGQASSGDAQADTTTGEVAQGEADQAATGTDSAQGSARPTGLFAHLKKPGATAQVSES